jgi:hypothetical protein
MNGREKSDSERPTRLLIWRGESPLVVNCSDLDD